MFVDFAFAIKTLRLASGLSQKQLAARMDVPRTYVSKIETRNAIPTIPSLANYARALNVTMFVLASIATASERIAAQ